MRTPQVLIGIDPGAVSGALAILYPQQAQHFDDFVLDIPVVDRMVNAPELARILKPYSGDQVHAVAVIEQVSAMPKQGVTSSFRFGMGVGLIRGVVQGLGIPLIQVTASKWKAHFRLDADKEKTRALAIRLYPRMPGLSRKKDQGRAEALLIAKWYLSTLPLQGS